MSSSPESLTTFLKDVGLLPAPLLCLLLSDNLQLPFLVKHHQPRLPVHFGGHMATAAKGHAKPKQCCCCFQHKDQRSRAETKKRPTMERGSAAGPSMVEECPLELSLATLRPQVRSSASAGAGEGTVELRPAWSVHGPSMSALYAELRALLPNMPPTRRMNREEILDAAAAQVTALENTAAVLEAYRGVPRRRRNEVAVSGAAVCFSARLPAAGPGALRRVLEVFHRRGVEVLAATMTRHGGGTVADAAVMVTAAAAPPEVMEMVRADIACIR